MRNDIPHIKKITVKEVIHNNANGARRKRKSREESEVIKYY